MATTEAVDDAATIAAVAIDFIERINRALTERADLLADQGAGFRRCLEAMKKPDRKPPADATAVLVLEELVNALEQETTWLRRMVLATAPPAGST